MKRRTYKLNDSNRLQLLTKPLSYFEAFLFNVVFNRGAAAVIVLAVVSFLYVFVGT